MSLHIVDIQIHRPWSPGHSVFLLGPGGVGKSTLGRELASCLRWPLIDLDTEFCSRIGMIGDYISAHGYERYRAENLGLAKQLVSEVARPFVYVMPSGFLTADRESLDYIEAKALVASGYGLTLLPSTDIEVASKIVVERQLSRGFNLRRVTEERKLRNRFPIYLREGDALIVSYAEPRRICDEIVSRIFRNASALNYP